MISDEEGSCFGLGLTCDQNSGFVSMFPQTQLSVLPPHHHAQATCPQRLDPRRHSDRVLRIDK
jgi:hypothetical protein